MVHLNYQQYGSKGFHLRLRLHKDGEVRYVNVTKLLTGNIKKQHWNQKKQYFTPSCPFQKENNEVLTAFKQKYQMMAVDWDGTILEMMLRAKEDVNRVPQVSTVKGFIDGIVEEMKANRHEDGTMKCSFEGYTKCGRRLAEYCQRIGVDYESLKLTDLTVAFIHGVFDWVNKYNKGKGLRYISVGLHAIIVRADKLGILDIDDYKSCRWAKKRGISSQKYHALTEEQCKAFVNLEFDERFSKFRNNRLYKDFCHFLLCTGQSPCDALSLRYSDIEILDGVPHFVFKRRKISEKQTVPCAVPIGIEMQEIMDRWKKRSKGGYIFPVRGQHVSEKNNTNNDIKHFVSHLNLWLKVVGEAIGCNFPLHTYTFRHTAITRYISKGVPLVYLANMMGTSVSNFEKVYYNNHGDAVSRNKAMSAMSFG